MGEGTLQCVWALSFHPKTLARAVGTELFTQGVFNSQHPLPVPSKECCTIQDDKVSFAISTPFSQIQRRLPARQLLSLSAGPFVGIRLRKVLCQLA